MKYQYIKTALKDRNGHKDGTRKKKNLPNEMIQTHSTKVEHKHSL